MRLILLMCTLIGVSGSNTQLGMNVERFTGQDSYCYCGMVDGQPDGWDPKGIWLDIFIIFDTSISMADHLEEAKTMVTSFVAHMNTDRATKIHSRIGIIDAADTPKMVNNLHMNPSDDLDSVKLTNATTANFDEALHAAILAFSSDINYATQIATVVQQVVFYLTTTAPSPEPAHNTQAIYFKTHGGIIIVNDFGSDGTTENLGLKSVASQNYYFTDLSKDYMRNLAVLCEANCFCSIPYLAFNDDDNSPRTQANRGCYEFMQWNTYNYTHAKARQYCSRMGAESFPVQGTLVSIHDQQKEFFLNSIASPGFGPRTKYWIAMENNGTAWNWEDNVIYISYLSLYLSKMAVFLTSIQSTDPFSDWALGQPDSSNGQSRCAYATQAIGLNVKWSAADCDATHDFVCETAPCSVGYLCMPCMWCNW